MKEQIRKFIQEAIERLQKEGKLENFEMPEIQVGYPKNEQFGDYTSNIALVIGKILKKNPVEISQMIAQEISNENLEKVEVAGPGHLNFYLSKRYFQQLVADINEKGNEFGNQKKKSKKIMVEYSQPNTHKEFHIGHLRNVIIGSTLVNILKKSGYEVVAANYIGDTGTHVAKCLWGLKKFYDLEKIEDEKNKGEFLGNVYSRAVQEIEENPEYEKEFREVQKKLEEGDKEWMKLWEKTRKWSLENFKEIYGKLGVLFNEYFYESEEEMEGKKMLPKLLENKFIKKSEGAIIADLEEFGLGVLVLVRNNGAILYGLKDIPLALKKFNNFKIDESVIITDIRQGLYFKQIFKILELLGIKKEMRHLGYEFVALKGGETMSSRKGNVISAWNLFSKMNEAVKKGYPKSPEPEAISLGAIKFSMLKYSTSTKIEFDMDEALKYEGATGPYVQYAYARVCSILNKAESEAKIDFKQANLSLLDNAKELSVIRVLSRFGEIIDEISADLNVNKMSAYALELADTFHSFYDSERVIDMEDQEKTKARLKLITAVQIILSESMRLMGIESPKKM